jgi:hypothetical protein
VGLNILVDISKDSKSEKNAILPHIPILILDMEGAEVLLLLTLIITGVKIEH